MYSRFRSVKNLNIKFHKKEINNWLSQSFIALFNNLLKTMKNWR